MRYYLAALFVIIVFIVPWFTINFPLATYTMISAVERAGSQIAGVFTAKRPVSSAGLKSDYAQAAHANSQKVRILVVPGHEPGFGGAEYGDLKERDINVELASELIGLLRNNPRYEVFTTRNQYAWMPEFDNYFKAEWNNISAWVESHKEEIRTLTEHGYFEPVNPDVFHNEAPKPVATRLYGISKWANENSIDIAIHIHFNDYPRKNHNVSGKYTGFAIYVPEKQYYNSEATKALASKIFNRLEKYNPISNLKGEREGIIEDQELIALGSFNSLDSASMLVEYSYIYEPHVTNPETRRLFMKEAAYATYLGVLDFFDPAASEVVSKAYDTLALPYRWNDELTGEGDSTRDVFALQTALILDGVYPPVGSSLRDCPRTGKFGSCTKSAVEDFQEKYYIRKEKGVVGAETINILNRLHSGPSL